jgi:hypothetical protein
VKPRRRKGFYLNVETGALVEVIYVSRHVGWSYEYDDNDNLQQKIEHVTPAKWLLDEVPIKRMRARYGIWDELIDLTPDIWARLIPLEEAARIVREHLTADITA